MSKVKLGIAVIVGWIVVHVGLFLLGTVAGGVAVHLGG